MSTASWWFCFGHLVTALSKKQVATYRIHSLRTITVLTTLVVLSQAISGGQNINDLNLNYQYSMLMFLNPIHKPEASKNSYQETELPNGKVQTWLRYKV